MTTAYLAAEGYEAQLATELATAGVRVAHRHGRLVVSEDPPVDAAWAANTWFDATYLPVASIREAADALRAVQRNWSCYAPLHAGRARLVEARLPHVSARPLALGAPAPDAPLGAWTLLSPNLLLAAARTASPFPNGEVRFVEDRDGPPSRAYLKLWEAFVRLGRHPVAGDRCIDLGASPGGWTWTMARLGASVLAIDKAPLDPAVASMAGVTWREGSAYALDPATVGPVDWLCSDVIAYPAKTLALVERWSRAGCARNMVVTIKFQGDTDHEIVAAFRAIEGGRVFHLHHNKHELTFARAADPTDDQTDDQAAQNAER